MVKFNILRFIHEDLLTNTVYKREAKRQLVFQADKGKY